MLVDPGSILGILPGTTQIQTPNDPSLSGRTLYAQGLFVDLWRKGPASFLLGPAIEIRVE